MRTMATMLRLNALKLTGDCETDWITGSIADRIGSMTHEWSPIIAGHVGYGESGASISELNSFTGCDLGAAVHPEKRKGGSRGNRARHDDWAVELHQAGFSRRKSHIWNSLCGRRHEDKGYWRIISYRMVMKLPSYIKLRFCCCYKKLPD